MLIFPLVLSACSNGSDTGTKPNPNTVPKSDPAPVPNPSGGEAKNRDFSLSITYQIKDGVLIQTKKEQAMMDSPFDRLELLKTPLVKGASWSQQVTNREGQSVELQTVIEDVKEENGAKIYRVLYRQPGSEYYEKREFKEGIGVLSFEKNWFNEGQWYPMGYQLYEEMSGYQ